PIAFRLMLLILACALLIYGFLTGLPRPDANRYQFAAANWISAELPSTARVLSNNNQVIYYAHRPPAEPAFFLDLANVMATSRADAAPDIGKLRDWSQWDYLVLALRRDQVKFVDTFAQAIKGNAVQRFPNGRG